MKSSLLRASLLVLIVIGLPTSCASAPESAPPPAAEAERTASPSADASAASEKASVALEEVPAAAEVASSEAAVPAAVDELESRLSHETGEAGATGARGSEEALAEKGLTFIEEPSPASETGRSGTRPASPPGASGLQAGFADDNQQFNYFLGFLAEYGTVPHLPIPVDERIIIKVVDSAGKPVPNAEVRVTGGETLLAKGRTCADGTMLFFPSEHGASLRSYAVAVSALSEARKVAIERAGKRQLEVQLRNARPGYQSVPLDLLFILDTTGSMGEEIQRLKTTIELINLNLTALSSRPRVRFGLVLYRDRGDEYTTRVVPLTDDLEDFKRSLARVSADGGGDDPEDLQSALFSAMREIRWNSDGIRLAFVVTDAAPHLDYRASYTYADAAHDARASGIKLFSVGTGGLDVTGELPLRQIAQYTSAKYIFLTYGERGESEGGSPGSVSHHTGSNYQTDKLEAIIIRFAREELAHLTDQPVADEGDWFQANRIGGEEKAETLAKLFDEAISQIVDYASIRIAKGTSIAALPIAAPSQAMAADAEYFGEQEVLSLARNRTFSMVERRDLQAIMEELELQLSGIADEANAARVGKILDAQMLITARMYDAKEAYEIFVKLLRVETGEILSVTKLVIDKGLGL